MKEGIIYSWVYMVYIHASSGQGWARIIHLGMVAHQWLQARQNASNENATARKAEAASRFAMNKRIRERAATLRQAAEGSPALAAMRDVVGHRQLSSFLKDGSLLCGAYQLGRCSQWENDRGAAHRCAVLLQSGRVCGGRQPKAAETNASLPSRGVDLSGKKYTRFSCG